MSKLIPVGRDYVLLDAATQSINLILANRLSTMQGWVSAVQVESGEYDIRVVYIPDGGVLSYEGAHHAHCNGTGKRNGDHFLTRVVLEPNQTSVSLYLDDVFVGIYQYVNGKLFLDSPEQLADKTKRFYNTIGGLIADYLQTNHLDFFIDPYMKQDD